MSQQLKADIVGCGNVAIMHNYHYYGEYELALRLMGEGAVGRVRHITLNFLGVPDHPGAAEYRPTWRHDPAAAGGGILMDMIHAVYLAEHLMGGPIRAVSAVVDNLDHPAEQVEDFTIANYHFDGGYATVNMWWGKGPGGVEISGTEGRGNLTLSALNCSGNILDGDEDRRARSQQIFFDTLKLANLLGVRTVVAMSGCPGESTDAGRYPNWVTSTWQPEYQALLAWQWEAVITPFWRKAAQAAAAADVRIAIEMHPGQAVYNPYTLQQLMAITGSVVGANLDPSHLFWQGIDPLRVIAVLGPSIYHVHAKDCSGLTLSSWRSTVCSTIVSAPPALGSTARLASDMASISGVHLSRRWPRRAIAAASASNMRDSRADAAAGTRRTVQLLRRVLA